MLSLSQVCLIYGGMTSGDLRAWRVRHYLSRPALARALGISVSRLVDYETGVTRGRNTPAPIPRLLELALKGLEQEMREG